MDSLQNIHGRKYKSDSPSRTGVAIARPSASVRQALGCANVLEDGRFGGRVRMLLKRGKAMMRQATLELRIPGTRTAHPYHPESRVPQGW